jgi:hypothetical protein
VSPDQLEVLVERLEEQLPAASYDIVGIGWSADDDGPLVATAYHFDSEDVAEESPDVRCASSTSRAPAFSPGDRSATTCRVEGDRGLRRRGDLAAGEDATLNFANQALISRDLLVVSRWTL